MDYNDILMHHYTSSDFLCHHGIKGQKWGVRRFQNPDGTLTAAGKKRYSKSPYDAVFKTYNIKRHATELQSKFDKYAKTEQAMRDHEKQFGDLATSEASKEKFDKYFERGLKSRTDSDDLRNLCREELASYRRDPKNELGGNIKNVGGFEWAYDEYRKDDPSYEPLYDKWIGALRSLDNQCYMIARKELSEHGRETMQRWAGPTSNNRKSDLDWLAFLIYNEAREQHEK